MVAGQNDLKGIAVDRSAGDGRPLAETIIKPTEIELDWIALANPQKNIGSAEDLPERVLRSHPLNSSACRLRPRFPDPQRNGSAVAQLFVALRSANLDEEILQIGVKDWTYCVDRPRDLVG